jgi:hypothetical protein
MNELLDKVQEKIDSGKPISCLSEGLLRDTSSSKLTKRKWPLVIADGFSRTE